MTKEQVQQMQLRHRKWMMGDQQNDDLQDDALGWYSSDTELLIRFALSVLAPDSPVPAAVVPVSSSGPATTLQTEEIIRLLNHPLIARTEKTKMLVGLRTMKEDRAWQAIDRLRAAIEDRQAGADLSTKTIYAP